MTPTTSARLGKKGGLEPGLGLLLPLTTKGVPSWVSPSKEYLTAATFSASTVMVIVSGSEHLSFVGLLFINCMVHSTDEVDSSCGTPKRKAPIRFSRQHPRQPENGTFSAKVGALGTLTRPFGHPNVGTA